MKSTFNQMFNQEEKAEQNGTLFNGICSVRKVFTLKSLEFFDQIAHYSHASESDESSTSPKDEFEESDESHLLVFDEKKSDTKIRCEVCGCTFRTRSQKWYHRKKFAEGTGCNVKLSLGRPKKSTKSVVERRTEKIENKQEKLLDSFFL